MLQPIAAPTGAGVDPDDAQHHECVQEQCTEPPQRLAHAESAEEAPCILPGHRAESHGDGGHDPTRNVFVTGAEAVDPPHRQVDQDERKTYRTAELFERSPWQAPQEKEAWCKEAGCQEQEYQDQLEWHE
jgi:hypothetical protein